MRKQKKQARQTPLHIRAFATQPISQPDHRQERTGVALPEDENVQRNKDWVERNEK